MLLVVAGDRDQPAQRFVEAHRARGVRRLSPRDLSTSGWQLRVSEPGADRCVVSGEPVPTDEVTGVITRITSVREEDLPHIEAPDRAYVAAEMSAFLLAWLSALGCPVLNRPTPQSLMGPGYFTEQWMVAAARAGLSVPQRTWRYPERRSLPAFDDGVTVTVVGDRCFGAVHESLAQGAQRLAAAAGTELLSVQLAGRGLGAAFLGAHLWPDISAPEVAGAIFERLLSVVA